MNPNLPLIIKEIFSKPDPIIWNGIWLDTLEILLNDIKMVPVWDICIKEIKQNHQYYKNMPLEQYIKWEIKGFIAQIIKLRKNKIRKDEFVEILRKYFKIKKILINDDILGITFDVIFKK
tara:strand:- start:4243 stop:4602 length:360 start_codon:yes stop_codon:yes gene_type:complete